MIDRLITEPHTDPDAVFRNFQRHNFTRACEHFGLTVMGPPSFGWRLRSIGAPVAGPEGPCWLRVISEETQWARGHGWTGNLDANSITDVAKPRVLDLLAPQVANTVHAAFADVLDTPTGRIAQLYVVARLMRRIDGGDYPELAAPLKAHANALIGT